MFLVGKPGSSKSLAKTIVADAMQGNAAHKDLFKNYSKYCAMKSWKKNEKIQITNSPFHKNLYD
jgi:hypothetical protein